MLITSEMLAYAAAEYPNASLKALQVAQDNHPDQSPGTEQSDYDCYICSLAEAVIEFPAMALQLVEDGRDISRLVDVTGRELRTGYSSAAGKHFIRDALAGTILDYFTQDEIDEICSAGTERPLDVIAGTTVTTINW